VEIHKNAFFRVSRSAQSLRIELANPKDVIDYVETLDVNAIIAFMRKYPSVSVVLPSLGLEVSDKKKEGHPANERLAQIAEREALRAEELTDGNCYAWNTYVKPLIPAMQSLGHIGKSYVRINWCACFAYSVMQMAKINIPAIPEASGVKFWASSALCEALEWYAKKTGCYIKNRISTTPERGWIVFYDWDNDDREDHVGIVLADEGGRVISAEGNRRNKSVIIKRNKVTISGYADFSRFAQAN
jgi:hypothetical protein